MPLSILTNISPIDGRYRDKLNELRDIFSEFGLLKYRVQIEINWLQKLSDTLEIKEVPVFCKETKDFLNNIINNFDENDANHIKSIERNINHDVKAVEYFIKEKIKNIPELYNISEFVHFACTSEDINNLSYAIILKKARHDIIVPYWNKLIKEIKILAKKYKDIPVLSRTHGQPATPSTIGKEMANTIVRMQRQLNQLNDIEILGKMNGAVGNYNAHCFAYPEINWIKLAEEFVTAFGITCNHYTTQIEPHDYISELFDCIKRFNNILIDFNRDLWSYISLSYFKQKITNREIGSSTMPHKINPIDLENSEGNLGISNAMMQHLSNKLPISRWQRDLTDSTVLRNIGSSISYSILAYKSALKGISKLEINKDFIISELNNNWAVLAEPIQTIMRRYGIDKPYEKLRNLTRGNYVNASNIYNFINTLDIPEQEKTRLKNLTPCNYIGYAIKLVNDLVD
ncbi:adenylosuccinate lyase [Candidatus Pantoea edessiphila]|uniref:Adenylosuccinate lyase n=1 Tax=Candidatus Pantoea edessiphila TaxID=2044610 RepID=A0A2P5SYV0_9GAMM|nr:adenylosuccinate lyase [Candidatus Pantoea edessiphila]MBK4775363.1 adenylosuccinate lyase [Pantoea sp. Edef]PPI87505.1 adenylosuccinate lyase [Candidatus Pantoea edessiphila]